MAMSAQDGLLGFDEFDTDEELEEYMQDVYRDLRAYWQDRHSHDRDGYFAQLAGSMACEALGHKPDPDFGWDDDDEHPWGFDDILCEATRYGKCCTQCEGECDFTFVDPSALWKAVAA
jgi:hypothetical protein